jgi:hypothetical protein
LNLRPPGYEPGELPDCSTPRRGPDCSTLVTIDSMWNWAIWGALIFAFLAGIAALVLLVRRTRTAYRAFDRTHGALARELADVTARGEATAARAETTAGVTSELQESLERLRVSLAELAVLTAALGDVNQMAGRVAAVVPRK